MNIVQKILVCFLVSGSLYAHECITSPKNYSTKETADIKRYFSEHWLKNHEKTFAIKILPRLTVKDGVLTYQFNSCTPKAQVVLADCKIRTLKLSINHKDKAAAFKCDKAERKK